jgi:hypothetical protein
MAEGHIYIYFTATKVTGRIRKINSVYRDDYAELIRVFESDALNRQACAHQIWKRPFRKLPSLSRSNP